MQHVVAVPVGLDHLARLHQLVNLQRHSTWSTVVQHLAHGDPGRATLTRQLSQLNSN